MGLRHSETSCILYDISGHIGLDEFDSEGERSAVPLEVRSAAAGSLWCAPEEKVRVFSVVEQYEPSESPHPERIDSARPLSPWWSATLAGAVLLTGVSSGLFVGTQVLPEPRTTHAQVHPASTAEARSFPTTRPMASAPARSPGAGPAARQQPTSGHVSRVATDSGQGLESDELRRAFASLDTQDIPFEQCAVRVPALDRVVIRCHARRGGGDLEGDWSAGPPAEWTVDFNRALNRWQVVSAPAL